MSSTALTGLDRKRLRRWLALFFLTLAVPTAVLIRQAYSELKWEAFHHYRLQAEELAARIDDHFSKLINSEGARPFTDYAFLNVAGDPSANFLQRSPLSTYPVDSAIPGLIGYFQVDARGAFSSPLVPRSAEPASAYGISQQELQQRAALAGRIQRILSENRLVKPGTADVAADIASGRHPVPASQQSAEPAGRATGAAAGGGARPDLDDAAGVLEAESLAERIPAQAAFDQLKEASTRRAPKQQKLASTLGRVEDLKLDYRYQDEVAVGPSGQAISNLAPSLEKRARKERSALPEAPAVSASRERGGGAPKPSEIRIRTFESEIDPFEVSLLDSGHFVLFRKVWRDRQRYIQGALIERRLFLHDAIETAFQDTALSRTSDLIVAYQGDVFSAYSGQAGSSYPSRAEALSGSLIHQVRLSAPLSDLELIFTANRLPAGPGGTVINWVAAILALVLCGGFYLMYRLGVKQIDLVGQQQDFVSAISHELKTPLTSIRMYGEMLREGWAPEEKKKTYYEYIHDESERLSRLISNVLQLARMTRNAAQPDLKNTLVSELMEHLTAKVCWQIERSGFRLNLSCADQAAQAVVLVDADYFTQIGINLVDNAIKFAAKAENRQIDIGCRLQRDNTLVFSVRDYGPGVPKSQLKKIFKLFYRSENELTRETVGTGIGLALVHQLTLAMKGRVDVVNKAPGAEFSVCFSSQSSGNP